MGHCPVSQHTYLVTCTYHRTPSFSEARPIKRSGAVPPRRFLREEFISIDESAGKSQGLHRANGSEPTSISSYGLS